MPDLKLATATDVENMKDKVFLDVDLRKPNTMSIRACVRTDTGTVIVSEREIALSIQTLDSINQRGGPL